MVLNKATTRFGMYLRDYGACLDPAAFGFCGGRRRTPGLRPEELASRANIIRLSTLGSSRAAAVRRRLICSTASPRGPELGMIIYNPASPADAKRLRVLPEGRED